MSAVVLMRHGEVNAGKLTIQGEAKVRKVCYQLQILVGQKPVIIYSSPLERAKNTAQILSESFEVPVEVSSLLFAGVEPDVSVDKVLSLIQEGLAKVSTVIVVTHLPHALVMPSKIAELIFGFILTDVTKLSYGEALVIDADSRTVLKVI